MKKLFLFFMMVTCLGVFADEITVYGPSTSKWIGKKYAPIFKKKTGHDIKYVSVSGATLKLLLEKNNPKADIVVGLTDVEAKIAENKNLLTTYDGKNLKKQYDYSYLAINYNKEILPNPPKNLKEMSKLKNQLLIQNPMTSNTGEEALLWSIAMYGKNWKKFWEEIKPAIKNVEPGWTEAFNKFAVNESPMMIGYATSNIYFVQDENQKNRLDSFYLEDGAYKYNEYAGIVNRKDVKEASKQFMQEISSDEFQKMVSTENYMYPVNGKLIDPVFSAVPTPKTVVSLTEEQIQDLSINLDKYKKELVNLLKK